MNALAIILVALGVLFILAAVKGKRPDQLIAQVVSGGGTK